MHQLSVMHHISTTGPPVSGCTRRLAPERLKVAHDEFEHMLELGIIRLSASNWASVLHIVPKKKPGDWCPCDDYHALNRATTPDCYPSPIFTNFPSHFTARHFSPRLTRCEPTTSTSGTSGHTKDGNHYTIRCLRIRPYAIRIEECGTDLLAVHGSSASCASLRLHLYQ